MSNWKAKIGWKDKKYLYLALIALTGMTIYQQVLITDLQTRMMNIEASRYDDQLNDIRWEAEKALEENKEQQKDILHLQKHSSEDRFHIMEMQCKIKIFRHGLIRQCEITVLTAHLLIISQLLIKLKPIAFHTCFKLRFQ